MTEQQQTTFASLARTIMDRQGLVHWKFEWEEMAEPSNTGRISYWTRTPREWQPTIILNSRQDEAQAQIILSCFCSSIPRPYRKYPTAQVALPHGKRKRVV
jgi:hypothetical protein